MVELVTAHLKIAYSIRGAFGAINHKFSQSECRFSSPYCVKNYYFNEDVAKTRYNLTT